MSDNQVVSASTQRDEDLDQVEIVEGISTKGEIAAGVASMCASLIAVVAAGVKASHRERAFAVRDRVLVPEIKVGDVIDVAKSLRPRVMGVIAAMCGAGAERLKTAERTINSKVDHRS